MIRISAAIGSREFVRPLRRAGAPCGLRTIAKMPYGDFWFWGNGRNGRAKFGIERKTIAEIVSSIGDNRFIGHQLPGLLKAYDYRFIVIEGDRYIDHKTGLLNPQALKFLPRKAHLYRTVQKFELTLMLKGGVIVVPTKNKTHTVEFIMSLYEWANNKTWDQHSAAYQVEENKPDAAILADRTMKRKIANQLTNLAWKRTVKADQYFPSIVAMIVGDPNYCADRQTVASARVHWRAALGFKAGTKIANAIVDVCHLRDAVHAKGR